MSSEINPETINHETSTKQFASGMVRSAAVEHLDFTGIHPIFMIALARTISEGAEKYPRNNWELGCDVLDCLNHVQGHLEMYKAGDRSEPHLEHAAVGLMFAIVNGILHPEMSEPYLRGPGCILTSAMVDRIAKEEADKGPRRNAGEFKDSGRWKLEDVPEIEVILAQRAEILK